jgi:hypothetical protein
MTSSTDSSGRMLASGLALGDDREKDRDIGDDGDGAEEFDENDDDDDDDGNDGNEVAPGA